MNMLDLAQEIIKSRRITRKDDLSAFLTCGLKELCEGFACIIDNICERE